MGAHEPSLYPLLLISALALIVPLVLHRIRVVSIPVVVGEIVCGVIVGRSGFDLIHPSQWLDFLSMMGFAYLMFLGGMEIDFSLVFSGGARGVARNKGAALSPMALALAFFVGNLALSYLLGVLLVSVGLLGPETNTVIFALLLGTTSVGVILPVLKETGNMTGKYGQTMMLAAVAADFITISLATVAVLLFSKKSGGYQIIAVVALCIVFYLLYKASASFASRPIIRRVYRELANTSAQVRVRTAFALMLLFAVVSQILGAEVILGAFIAGVIFSALFQGESWENEVKFDAIGFGFFIPVFFIMVGARLDLSLIWKAKDNIALAAALLIGAFAVKLIPALIFAPQFGLRKAAAGGFLLAGQLSLLIAFAQVAVGAGLLPPSMEPIGIAIAIVTCIVSPIVFTRMTRSEEQDAARKVDILILGAGKVGRTLARRFQERGHRATLLDVNRAAVDKARTLGLNAIHYTVLDENILKQAGANRAGSFVAVTNMDQINFDACMRVRELFGVKNLVARVGNPDNIPSFAQNGVRPMNTTLASVVTLENLIYRPNVFHLLSHENSDNEVVEVVITNPGIGGRKIRDINVPEEALILMVQKGGIASVPHGNTRLDMGDVITLLVRAGQLGDIARLFDPHRPDHHTRHGGDAL
jgi:Kef-type K+ transport system membrane component KefB/Trk K+ transport system NAD-binding subunit